MGSPRMEVFLRGRLVLFVLALLVVVVMMMEKENEERKKERRERRKVLMLPVRVRVVGISRISACRKYP